MNNKKIIFLVIVLLSLSFILVFMINYINQPYVEEFLPQEMTLDVENPVSSAPLTPKNAFAIVVGISDYPGSTSDLSYCDDDAQDVYQMLINDYNFKPENVIYLQDSSASKGAIDNAFNQIASHISSEDIFFFYYSGHGGAQTQSTGVISYSVDSPHPYSNYYDNMWSIYHSNAAYMRVHFDHFETEYNYDYVYLGDTDLGSGWYYEGYSGYSSGFWSGWIPLLSDYRLYIRLVTDSSITDWGFSIDSYEAHTYDGTHFLCSYDSIPSTPANYYLDSLLDSKLDQINCDERYIILDACNTGGMIPEVQQVGRYIMTACDDEESSLESPSLEHGVFTNFFLESFDSASDSNADGVISMEESFSYTSSSTISYSSGMGYTHHPQQYDGISGESVLFTTFGALSLIPTGNSLSYSFNLYGTGLIESLRIAAYNNSNPMAYTVEDLTENPASETGFGYYSGILEINGVTGITDYGIFARVNGNEVLFLNLTISNDIDSDSIDDITEIMFGMNISNTDSDSDGLDDYTEFYGITNPTSNDTDNDGMDDFFELHYNLDPINDDSNEDEDNDGLNNLLEYQLGSFVNDTDTDDDLMLDGWEYINNLNLLVDDTSLDPDLDGIPNIHEFGNSTDPQSPDTDSDTIDDGDEILVYFTNPCDNDTDEDGLTDDFELFVYFTNATDEDSEGDGMDDYYEFIYGFDPLNNDSGYDPDEDGLSNLLESQYYTNPLNPDSDGDFMNDHYEVQCNLNPLVDDANADEDNDGLSNLLEFLLGSNANDVDSDNDHMPDYWEYNNCLNLTNSDGLFDNDDDGLNNVNEYNLGTNPQNPDTDYDGLMDGNEVQIYFTNPFNPDTDGDGYYDGIEVLWGTNPLDPRTSLTTIFLNIAGGVLLIGSVYYVVRTQVYAKKHKEKIPKGKFYVDKKIEGYNALSIKKEIKPKPVYKPRTYTPTYGRPYIPPTGRVTPPDLKEVRNLIIYGLPTPKPSYSLEGQRALNIANHAFKLFNQGQYQASIQSMLHALMLGVPEPMNSHLKKIILDSLDRVIGSEKITQPAIPSSSVSSTPTVKCSICGTLNKDINKFCKNCGKPLERVPLTKNCGFCGASNGISNKFCTKCGREL